MAVTPKFGNFILCEHVIQGIGNKYTLVNVYSGDILLSEFPATIALGLYAEFFSPKDAVIEFEVELTLNGKNIGTLMLTPNDPSPPSPPSGSNNPNILAVPLFNVHFVEESIFEAFLKLDGAKPKRLMSRRIFAGSI